MGEKKKYQKIDDEWRACDRMEKRVLHRVHTIHTAILIHPGETIPMMFIIMMIRMISPMTGLRNLVEEIMMADRMMRMITGRKTTGNNNARKLWR